MTNPVGFIQQPEFTNAVCKLYVDLDPFQLLKYLMQLQNNAGRKNSFQNGPRILDIDLISYSNVVLDTPLLKLPHPRMENRLFVLIPLMELDPLWVDPVSKKSISKLVDIAYSNVNSFKVKKMIVENNWG